MADLTGRGDPMIYMPSDFQLTQPTEAEFFGASGLFFTRGQDSIWHYTIDEPEGIGDGGGYPTIIPFVSFANDNGKTVARCLK
jgi:hypothetical protein